MIRRLALAAVLALLPSLASAQFATIGPTPVTSDNGDRLATTAWVNNLVNAGLPLASGKIWIGSAGNVATAQTMSGDATLSIAGALTLATVNVNTGAFGSATSCVTVTNNAKGLTTAVSAVTCTPAISSITGLGTGIATALAINVGTAGAPVINGGALGTPSSGVATNLTGTAAGLTAGNVTTNANLTGAVTSVGNAASLGSFTSANLAGALTNETGTGLAVFGTSPNITTPTGIVKGDVGLGNVANVDATNATNISSGTLAAARGGAGTITGALKGNGAGLVTQAAAADLSNGTSGSGAVALVNAPTFTGAPTTPGLNSSADLIFTTPATNFIRTNTTAGSNTGRFILSASASGSVSEGGSIQVIGINSALPGVAGQTIVSSSTGINVNGGGGLFMDSVTGGAKGTGTINATTYYAGGTVGVSCSGAPTASFASVNGIVTHC